MQEKPLVIEHREALVYMLCEGAELEHGIMCQYLYAAFSLKESADEGLTAEQLEAVERWRRKLYSISAQEMLHFALVTNVLTALGYAPHVTRPNLPAPNRHYPAEIKLELMPFGEDALEHFLFLERPEGMELQDAPGIVAGGPDAPLMGEDDIVPGRQGFATVGHLYRSIEAGLERLAGKYGEERIFLGSPRAQATPDTFQWPELVPVTDLASAKRALETIVEQGEGARGDWADSHYGQFVAIHEEYRAMRAADPGFEPARPCTPTYVRPPVDVDVEVLCEDPMTAKVADIFNVGYEVLLQVLARYFGHGHETADEAQALADTSVALMYTVIKPIGQLLTRLPAGPDRPGVTAGPAFELFYFSDYMLPHRRAAWVLLSDRLSDLASFAARLAEEPGAPAEIAGVRDGVLGIVATLADRSGGALTPRDLPAAAVEPDPRPELNPVTTRDELAALVSAAAGIEHALALTTLFAAVTLKDDVSEGGLTRAQAERARSWKGDLLAAADERLNRLADLAGVATAAGTAPPLTCPDDLALDAFSLAVAERLAASANADGVPLPPDRASALGCATLGDLYHRIHAGLRDVPLLFAPKAPAPADLPDLAAVRDEYADAGFEAAREVATGDITEEPARTVAGLFRDAYDTTLSVLALLAEPGADRENLLRAVARLTASVVRPLGEALTRLPADRERLPGVAAGPVPAAGPPLPPPKDQAAAYALIGQRLWDLAATATTVCLTRCLPGGLPEAAAALQDLACAFTPAEAGERLAELALLQADVEGDIQASLNGPYLVTGVESLTNHLGEPLAVRPRMALCRCGASAMMPLCDGAHARVGFTDEKDPQRVPDRLDTYAAEQVTVLDNRGVCAHSGFCTDRLSSVFHAGREPFVTAGGGRMDEVVRAVRACPSGALGFTIDGREAGEQAGRDRPPSIEVSKDGPYRVTGGIPLRDTHEHEEPRDDGASLEHYSLCRCGHSQNKPFCSGMHWYVNFHDPLPPADREQTLFEWAGGLPALTALTTALHVTYVPADPLVGPLFADAAPGLPERAAAWIGAAFGGPACDGARWPGVELTEEQRARWVTLVRRAADEVKLPADAEFRAAFTAFVEWTSHTDTGTPHWQWLPGAGPRATAVPEAADEPVTLPGPGETVGFEQHVKTLFRPNDRRSMLFVFDLWSYADATTHAESILARLRDGSMPCDGAWPPEKVDVFARWVLGGTPR